MKITTRPLAVYRGGTQGKFSSGDGEVQLREGEKRRRNRKSGKWGTAPLSFDLSNPNVLGSLTLARQRPPDFLSSFAQLGREKEEVK